MRIGRCAAPVSHEPESMKTGGPVPGVRSSGTTLGAAATAVRLVRGLVDVPARGGAAAAPAGKSARGSVGAGEPAGEPASWTEAAGVLAALNLDAPQHRRGPRRPPRRARRRRPRCGPGASRRGGGGTRRGAAPVRRAPVVLGRGLRPCRPGREGGAGEAGGAAAPAATLGRGRRAGPDRAARADPAPAAHRARASTRRTRASRPREPGDLRTARESPRDLAVQVGDRGSRVPRIGPGDVHGDRPPARRAARRPRALRRRRGAPAG